MTARIRSSDTRPDPSSAVPRERDPVTGRPVELDHDDKQRHRDHGERRPDPPLRSASGGQPPGGRPTRPRPRWLVPVGAAGVTVAIVVGVMLGTTRPSTPVLDADPVVVAGATAAPSPTAGGPAPASRSSVAPRTSTTGTGAGSAVAPPSGSSTGVVSRTASSRSAPSKATRTSTGAPPSIRSTPSRSTAAGPPAALTASRIWGYRITGSAPHVVNAELAGITVDTGYTGVLRCPGGRCPAVTGLGGITAFTAAAGRISSRKSIVGDSTSRCEPLVFTVDLVRDADGSYRGTSAVIPRATEASWNDGVPRTCRSFSVQRSITLGPLVTQQPAPAGTPAVLDPARITGYRYPGAGDTGAEYLPTCADGWCTMRCPIQGCTATIAFPAAPTRFTIPPVVLTTTDCGSGTVGFVVDRNANGVVVFTIARTTSITTQVCRRPEYLQAAPETR